MKRIVSARVRNVLLVARFRPFETTTAEGRSLERYRRIVLSTVASIAGRGVTTIVGLLTVPIALAYLGKEQYGLWATVSVLAAWVTFFDLGLVNGLLNAVSEAHGREDRQAVRRYFSTALFALLAIAAAVAVALFLAIPAAPWASIFSAPPSIPRETITASLIAAAVCVLAGLPLATASQMYVAFQKAYVATLFTTGASVLSLIGLLVAVRFGGGLAVVIAATSCAAAIAGLASLVHLLTREMPWLRPGLGAVSRTALRRLRSSSLPLYLFQVGALLVNQTQQLVLARRTGLATVAEYELLWRIYALVVGAIIMSTASAAPSFREAYERGETGWMRRAFWNLVQLRMSLALGASLLFVPGGNTLLRLWLHRTDFQYGAGTWLLLSALLVASVWTTCFVELATILDRIWPQVWVVLAQGTLTVALTWSLAVEYGLGGALVAITVPALALSCWILPLVARPLLRAGSATRAPSA